MPVVSARIRAADTAFAAVKHFYLSSRYGERRLDPGICDFTFGNPHEMPLAGIVAALREHAVPHDENCVRLQDQRAGAAGLCWRSG